MRVFMTTLESLISQAEIIKAGLTNTSAYGLICYSLANEQEYEVWKNVTIRFLIANFTDDRCIQDFEDSCKKFRHDGCRPNDMDKIIGILKSCTIIPVLPKKKVVTAAIDKSVNVNVHQSQKQEQSQIVAVDLFLEAIKDEITGKQLKELKSIVQEEPNPEKAKSRILDKVKSWGESISASIIANIITNPSIWSGLL